jgi:hypothetical protein
MPRLHRQRDEEQLDLAALRHEVAGWWGVKFQTKLLTKKLDDGKKALLKIVQRYGTTDPETGSLFLELDEPVSNRRIVQLKAQRSETVGLNPDEAEKILRGKGLWDEVVEYVPQLDEGKVHAAYFDRKITDDELARMFPKRIAFSLIILDEGDKPVN